MSNNTELHELVDSLNEEQKEKLKKLLLSVTLFCDSMTEVHDFKTRDRNNE